MKAKTMFYDARPITFKRAASLRRNLTESEKILWTRLSKNQLNGLRFKRQHPIGKYIADFYCHKHKLVIEIDGLYHNDNNQKEKDATRDQTMQDKGLNILRFTNDEVRQSVDTVISKIEDYLAQARGSL